MVGNEGMLGMPLMLGVDVSPMRALVQGSGSAMRLDAESFRRAFGQSPTLREGLNRYLYVLMGQVSQTAACTHFHFVEARLARWLLMTQDRANSAEFRLTQEFLAYMLGVRRVGVTNAARSLQGRKLIRYSRGHITVLDREGLEAVSCGCYQAEKRMYEQILG